MLILNPTSVTFDGETWTGVRAISIDYEHEKLIEGWGDSKPYATLVDVPRVRVRLRVTQEIAPPGLLSPQPGADGDLVFHAAIAGSGAGRKRVQAVCVVAGVKHDLGGASGRQAPTRTVELIAVSSDGDQDPIEITDDTDGRA